jgi:predicted transcriptional regulator
MHMQTTKQIVQDITEHLPDKATLDDVIYALFVRQKLEQGLQDLAAGRVYTQAEVEQRLRRKWQA